MNMFWQSQLHVFVHISSFAHGNRIFHTWAGTLQRLLVFLGLLGLHPTLLLRVLLWMQRQESQMDHGHLSMIADTCQWVFSGCSTPAAQTRSFGDERGSPLMGGRRAGDACLVTHRRSTDIALHHGERAPLWALA